MAQRSSNVMAFMSFVILSMLRGAGEYSRLEGVR